MYFFSDIFAVDSPPPTSLLPKYIKYLFNLHFKKRYGRLNKQNNPYASIFFYHVLIKYKNNFTLLPENLLREKKIVCFWGTAASYDFAVNKCKNVHTIFLRAP